MGMTPAQVEVAFSLYPPAYATDKKWGRGQKVLLYYSIGEAIHESWTKKDKPSGLALEDHNWWGIKAFGSWKGATVRRDTFEYENGVKVPKKAISWRRYEDDYKAFDDYGRILNGPLYLHAFDFLPTDPKVPVSEDQEHAFIEHIAKHWATDPHYARYCEAETDLVEEVMEDKIAFIQAVILVARASLQALGWGYG